ncbi:MAG: ABC transporter ATP-binding protein [Caldimonas sp.]|uniref:ABC transporter ATP-binding protein n=1 Tax=Caldimonas taiwanensis TaxID=307483 RepID=UPI0007826C7F|nr:ABC transporter ATP-binding protein [Caldimonas taiwanensis]GIX23257.1 MAG: ABC transporter ATP-binding protein [Caldimonas sp.]
MIQVEHLTRRYGALTAVDDVSFDIAPGEVVGLLGHNGAGKTTIMKMITGYLEPSAGSVRVDGLEVGLHRRAVQQRIGYLPENCPVWPEMTVIDYLDFQAALHGVPASRRAQAVARAMARTALKDKATAAIQTLSRGYRQRVGVAQALLHDPAIVILDEPTNGLDPTQILHMRELIAELARQATVIVSTHILQEVQASCERVLIMRAGRLVLDARLADLQRGDGLLVRAEGDVAAALRELPAVQEVRAEPGEASPPCWCVQAPIEAAAAVADALVRAGVRLHALQPRRRDLETVFAEVNGLASDTVREVNHA